MFQKLFQFFWETNIIETNFNFCSEKTLVQFHSKNVLGKDKHIIECFRISLKLILCLVWKIWTLVTSWSENVLKKVVAREYDPASSGGNVIAVAPHWYVLFKHLMLLKHKIWGNRIETPTSELNVFFLNFLQRKKINYSHQRYFWTSC